MEVEIMTKDDLQTLRFQIVEDIKDLLDQASRPGEGDMRGFRSKEVRYLLGCSPGKLKSLCAGGKIRMKKTGGTIYYNKDDVKRLLTSDFKVNEVEAMWMGRQMILFYRMMANDDRLRSQHVSLYFAIVSMAKEESKVDTIAVTRRELMAISRLSSKAKYHRCMRELERYGYVQYCPSYNPFLGSRVVLRFVA
jgi:hypothetical protein